MELFSPPLHCVVYKMANRLMPQPVLGSATFIALTSKPGNSHATAPVLLDYYYCVPDPTDTHTHIQTQTHTQTYTNTDTYIEA